MHQFDGPRIQEAVLGVFKKFSYRAMDLEALVYYVLQEFDVSPSGYEFMHRTVRHHILTNFAVEQGTYLRLCDVAMRRITVCYTIEKDQE